MSVKADVEAINAVYKKQEEKDFKKAIVESLKESKTRKNMPPNRKIIKKNGTRKNKLNEMAIKGAILSNMHQSEKHTLESQLPPELNGAMVDIIERDGHCFFRLITHQLRAYGFNVPTEYQTVRNLVAEYIEKTEDITLDMIISESPGYNTKIKYADALRKSLWGGKIEIIAIHDGCLSSLTDGQFLRINIYSVNNGQMIELHPGFIGTRPDDEGEQLIERLPIRLLYVGKNHFHRIYFDNIENQKRDYQGEVRPAELILGQPIYPDTGMTQDEKAQQLESYEHFQKDKSATLINDLPSKRSCSQCTYLNNAETANCEVCEAALNKANLQINNEWGMSEKEKRDQLQELEKYNNSDEYQNLPLISSEVDQITAAEFGFTPRTAADQIKALQQIEQQHGPKFVNIVEDDAYLLLVEKCMNDPFMIMGYQNGYPNLHYESTWKETNKKNTFIGRIYIPREENLNDRKYTRYPNPLMSNTDEKTIVNLSLHNWAFGMYYWNDKSKHSKKIIDVSIHMSDETGVSEVESTVENADFFSISKILKSIPYLVHDSSYSPDTGVLALDDKIDKCLCKIAIENGPILKLIFYRDKDDYKLSIGGTRKRRRQSKRRQSKRQQRI